MLCIGLLICTGIVYYQNGSFTIGSTNDDLFVYIIPIVALFGYFGSKLLYHKSLQRIKKETPFTQKLQSYLQASMLKYALLEGAGFFSLFAYFNTGNALFLVITFCMILYLYAQKPSLHRMKREIPLRSEEEKDLRL